MIVHADIKQVVSAVGGRGVSILVRPCESVAMDGSLGTEGLVVVVVVGEKDSVLVAVLDITQIGVVGRIGIDAVDIVRIVAITVAVVGLTVLGPTAIGRLGAATAELRVTRELNQSISSWSVVELLDVGCVVTKNL